MANISIKNAQTTFNEIASNLRKDSLASDVTNEFEIVISIRDNHVNVREFAAFLAVLDRVYGRVSVLGLRSYALRERAQLEILEVRNGSLLIHFGDSLYNFIPDDPTSLIILYLFLAYGPAGIKILSEAAKNAADTYKSFQEGRLASVNRRKLQEEMKNDPALRSLTDKQHAELQRMMRYLGENESRRIPAMKRFVVKFVKDIQIRVRKRKGQN